MTYAREMGCAALAVTIAPRHLRKDVLKRAAKKLKISQKKLETFRRNILAGDERIKSASANIPFEIYDLRHLAGLVPRVMLNKFGHLLDDDYYERILEELKPVPESHRDV